MDPRSKSTATAENALTPEERDRFLLQRLLSRFSTIRADGWPHTTPVWFLWENGEFIHSLGPDRQHLRNLQHNSKVTECVDVDNRLTDGLAAGACSVVCFGEAEIVDDVEESRGLLDRILMHYLGPEDAPKYLEPSLAEIPLGRRMVRVRPIRWLTWDFSKVD
jgi:nitroimidazol reductase NimA-like FMN-containing flavoprotein (pyridoxamine 5'-phosphate oxidase superfamily)